MTPFYRTLGAATLAVLFSLAFTEQWAQGQDQPRRGVQGRGNRDQTLAVGMHAPTFEVREIDGKAWFDLRDYRDKRPVILFFGSYT